MIRMRYIDDDFVFHYKMTVLCGLYIELIWTKNFQKLIINFAFALLTSRKTFLNLHMYACQWLLIFILNMDCCFVWEIFPFLQ